MPPSHVWKNPEIGFGRPCLRGSRLRTETIYFRWLAGETWEHIAEDHMIGLDKVIAAVHYEIGKRERYKGKDVEEALKP
jgi:uncharacterized protein (DUF433 family)